MDKSDGSAAPHSAVLDYLIFPALEGKVPGQAGMIGIAFMLIARSVGLSVTIEISVGILLTGICILILSQKIKEDGFFVGIFILLFWLVVFGETYKSWIILTVVSISFFLKKIPDKTTP